MTFTLATRSAGSEIAYFDLDLEDSVEITSTDNEFGTVLSGSVKCINLGTDGMTGSNR